MASAGTLSTAVEPPPRTLLIISRVRHPTTRNFKLSVPRSGQDSSVHLSHGFNIGAADFSSLDRHRSTIIGAALRQFSSALSKRPNIVRIVPYGKTLPFSVLARVLGGVYTEFTEKQQLLRHQIWFGYWIDPEDVDGWGFVEAYLLPI